MGLKTKLINSTLKIVDDNNNEFLIPKTDIRFKFSHDETTVILTDVKLNNAYSSLVSELEDVDTGLIGTKDDVELYLAARSGFNFATSESVDELTQNLSDLDLATEKLANKGAANGYAPLGVDSKVPTVNLPSYVQEVIEVANFSALPLIGITSVIYVTLDTNFVYRWSGSSYIQIGNETNFIQTEVLPLTGKVDVLYYKDSEKTFYVWIGGLWRSLTVDETTASIQLKRPIKTVNLKSLEGPGNLNIIEGFDFRYFNAVNVVYLKSTGTDYFANSTSGGGSGFSTNTAQNLLFTLGAVNSNCKTILDASNNGFVASSGDIIYSTIASLRLLDLDYVIRIGMMLGAYDNSDLTNGAHFKYDRNISNNWLLVSGNGATSTVLDSGITHTINLTNSSTKFRIEYNQSLNNLTYYINDVNVGVISTNIATVFGCGITAFKTGAGAKTVLSVNYQQMFQKLNTSR